MNTNLQALNFNSIKANTSENEVWETLFASKQNNTILEGTIKGTKTVPYGDRIVQCWMLELGRNVIAFIPQTETIVTSRKEFFDSIDETVTYIPLHIDRDNGLVLCSQKQALKALKSHMIKKLHVGVIYNGIVKYVTPFNLTVELVGDRFTVRRDQLGLYHKNLMEMYSLGDTIQLKVREIDLESEEFKITPVKEDKYLLLGKKYDRKGRYKATVKKKVDTGYIVELEPGLVMLCDFPANWPKGGFPNVGEDVLVIITKYIISKHRVYGKILRKM